MSSRAAPVDLTVPGRFHVVGVGGPGMSAIALVLAELGHRVSGSDLKDLPVLDRLRLAGVDVHVGHDRSYVHGVDAVTYSSAIPSSNVELAEARRTGVPALHRSALLASICAVADAVGVSGAHGKTTTSSMLAMILVTAGLDPGYVIGGDPLDVGSGARWGGGPFVVEADESDRTFLELPLRALVVTNIEPDFLHVGGAFVYDSFEAVVDAYRTVLRGVDGPRVLCLDDPVAASLAGDHATATYGLDPAATYRADELDVGPGGQRFTVRRGAERLGELFLPLRGKHNVRNALGATAMAMELGADFGFAEATLATFGGVARRFDVRGAADGITFVDDYAHLPSEIAAVLDAAATSGDGWRRIVAVFQPNRYSRMAVMSPDFRDAFVAADVAVVTDIYPSGEQPIPGITGKLVVDAVLDAHPDARVVWMPRRPELIEFLTRELRAGDVCISMGCGDVASLPAELARRRSDGGRP